VGCGVRGGGVGWLGVLVFVVGWGWLEEFWVWGLESRDGVWGLESRDEVWGLERNLRYN
jgi:hypothetical protein